MYRERPSRIEDSVVWSGAATTETRVLPDGCMDLLWLDGVLVVAGPDTAAYLSPGTGSDRVWGVRLASGIGPAAFGLPANELRDQRVRLDDLWRPSEVRMLSERVTESTDRGAMLESIAADRLADTTPDPGLLGVAAMLRRGIEVSRVADAVGYSERQLHRRSVAAFGYGPKMLSRIHRFQAALALVRSGSAPATAAAACGYADQAHLSRETVRLAGSSLRTLS